MTESNLPISCCCVWVYVSVFILLGAAVIDPDCVTAAVGVPHDSNRLQILLGCAVLDVLYLALVNAVLHKVRTLVLMIWLSAPCLICYLMGLYAVL